MRPYIRSAQPTDRDSVNHLITHTWEWGDFVPEVWNQWLYEPDGKLLVATLHRHPVALAHVVKVTQEEAWFEGLRVDSDYRRKGLATRMVIQCIKEASALGAKVLRFACSPANTPVHRIADKLGFGRIASYIHYQAKAMAGKGQTLRHAGLKHLPTMYTFLQHSPVLASVKGLYGTRWRFQRLNYEQLRLRLSNGMVRFVGHSNQIGALAIVESGYSGEGLMVSYADGQLDSLIKVALGLRAEADSHEPPKVIALLPETKEIRQAFLEAGYESTNDGPSWIYEKILAKTFRSKHY